MGKELIAGTKRGSVCRDCRDERDGTFYNAVDCFQCGAQRDGHVTRLRKTFSRALGALAIAVLARAQDAGPITAPSPLVAPVRGPSAGSAAGGLLAAQRAHDLGLPQLAADIYRQAREAPGADRTALTLALATALLDAGNAEEAERALAEIPEPRNAAWHLRAGLAAVQLRKIDAARAELAAIRESDLPEEDHPWWWFFQGQLVDLAPVRELSRANDFYLRAERAAPTELARARFQLAAERLRLRFKEAKQADLRLSLATYESNRGTALGYEAAETHAVALDALGQREEAAKFLQGVIATVPNQQRDWWDRLRLVLGIIGDKSRNGPGRVALTQLIEQGHDASGVKQRQALQMLEAASKSDDERKHFRDLLQKLVTAKPDHAIKESLLFFRAQLGLAEKDFLQAEEDAKALLQHFPRSPLRVHALGLLTQSAWEQRRFRSAADYAQKALAELAPAGAAGAKPPPNLARARADLGVLVAEARFRSGLAQGDQTDFRQAAEAYAAVVRERPAGLDPAKIGALMFQWVLAEIKAGTGEAGKVIDRLARDPAFDLENRWQAEWSLARALQLQGDAGRKEAYARVNALLREPATGEGTLKPELRARMGWLQARLAFENNEPEQAIRLIDALIATPGEIDAGLRAQIASTAVLLKAQAEFALGREPAAIETLQRLREDFKQTDAAIWSFIIESEHYAAQDKIDRARTTLIHLTDNEQYKNSSVVPYALYRLALYSERLGRDENLAEAIKRIEDLIAHPAAVGEADLIFTARMKQGDIFAKRNDFPAAQRAYETLVNNYGRRPDVAIAQLALAKTHNAQSSDDPSGTHGEAARLAFEQLLDRLAAPVDVRIEAGYNLGKLLERRAKLEEAARAWWRVIDEFMLKEKSVAELGPKRSYWLARTLVDLGEVRQKQGLLDEATAVYKLILEQRLPYTEVARARLGQLGANAPK